MNLFVSIVSHGHCDLIKNLGFIDKLSETYKVIIKVNSELDDFKFFRNKKNIYIIDDNYNCGFAHNNNMVFSYCINKLGMKENDYFLVLNPDVVLEPNVIDLILINMHKSSKVFATINLYKDFDFYFYDNSIRFFPKARDFIYSYLFNRNKTIIDKSKISEEVEIDWAAGSFLLFKASHYMNLNGFDESYFMYCEDIDICFRSYKKKVPLIYLPQFKAIHLAKHNNRKILSKHFYWHVRSVLYYLLAKYNLRNNKSSI
ncbi:glycosyltransferase family 2 protein [Photobacterium aquimaris]|uniref:Glycosyltransferase family 2 protein n=1 Tax=Photobacterium aquimaris TaxID=512643 RepID=A0A2T3IEB9_9GAMM|nr:glycosyltransferase family 2 protein [Photobacterium aquimaris]OBU23509.1 glycosyl transferase family 2 [Photobacterium aquimaris]PSU21390.1 glycosyltransferase family 2 protein [Photobacterium aquimaris]